MSTHNCPDCRCAAMGRMTNPAAAAPLTTFKLDHTIGAAAAPGMTYRTPTLPGAAVVPQIITYNLTVKS